MDTPINKKIPKKRGRKPKKKNEHELEQGSDGASLLLTPPVKEKKKRGRKKKCEMNLKDCQKISGFIQNLPTIDVSKNNKVTVNETTNNNSKEILEKVDFGGNLIIKKISASKKVNTLALHNNFLQQTSSSSSTTQNNITNDDDCKIDLSKLMIHDDHDHNELEIKQSKSIFKKKKKKGLDSILQKTTPTSSTTTSTQNTFNGGEAAVVVVPNHVKKRRTQKYNKSVVIFHKRGKNIKEWPQSTNVLCWWCCHSFEGMPCFIPTKYDEKRDRWKVTGNFCSWNCAKSYKLRTGNQRGSDMNMFTLLMKKLRLPIDVKRAPSPEFLIAFGGTCTIEEFRENSLTRGREENYRLLTSDLELDESYRLLRY